MSDQLNLPNGSNRPGSLQDLLNLMNATATTPGELVVFCVGENGEPSNVANRRALACGSVDDVNFDQAGEDWTVVRSSSGRFKVFGPQEIEIAKIGNDKKATFANGADFLNSFFQFGHLWPGGEEQNGAVSGWWQWIIPDAFTPSEPFQFVDDFTSLAIEDSNRLPSSVFYLDFLDDSVIPELEEVGFVNFNGAEFTRVGRDLRILVGVHLDDQFTPPVLTSNYSDPFTSPTITQYFEDGGGGNSRVSGFFLQGAEMNGFASFDGRLVPALVQSNAIEGPISRWAPSRGFASAIFED